MVKTFKYSLTFLLVCILFFRNIAQQDFVHTQYMFNLFSINPAYAGSKNTMDINLSHRSQWIGLDGAPQTQFLSIHSPILQNKVGLGLQISNDAIGPRKVLGVNTAYAYHIDLNKGKLGFGLRAGAYNFTYDWSQLNYESGYDGVIGMKNPNTLAVNFDFGVYYKNRVNYAGLEIAHLNQAKIYTSDSLTSEAHLYPHLALFYGHAFEINDNMVLKSSILARAVQNNSYIDVNLSMLFNDFLWFGASYKSVGIVGAITKFNISKRFNAGYSLDYPISNTFLKRTSHELFLTYNISMYKELGVSPRYF
ncbi:MAG: type IX secretion system membrane protein PorP/SprF [Flavobacteriales bacterium]|jgi:type IX secretion system PorP/SprF family membrane protein|nr:type IX secretion system membrane protein PorP/SprF [Flavobacteriales bacterium]